MNLPFGQLRDRYHMLSLRERLVIALALAVALIVAWMYLINDPLAASHRDTRQSLTRLHSQIASLSEEQAQLLEQQRKDPNAAIRQRLNKLRDALGQTEQRLRERFRGLIEPHQMAQVLEDLLNRNERLQLVRIESLATEPLIRASEEPAGDSDADTREVAVYRHGVRIQFRGSYLATVDYLKAIEGLPWDFYWDAVRLQVDEYPQALVTITVHTLSLKRGWIGV